jgi:lipopolysaccharide export system protein LptA
MIFILLGLMTVLGEGRAQSNKKINTRADLLEYDENLLPGAQRLLGHVVFRHDNTIGYCDSAYYYEDENYLIAFGRPVRINVDDSVQLYGRKAYYNGNDRTASIARKVEMVHGTAHLYSDSMTYDLSRDVGYFLTGGTMINVEDTLSSLQGHYYTKRDEVLLTQDVLLKSTSYTMDCDSLLYNTLKETVYFISRTHMVSDDNTIYTSSGWYETKTDIATLVDDVELINTSQHLVADSVYYDRNLRYGIGWNNVVISDTVKGYVLKGNYVEHYELGGYSTATDSNQLILIDEGKDSLFLHSDTLRILFDTLQEPQVIMAFNKVKFYRKDMQGACDSLAYSVKDSLITMFHNPVMWSGENQLSADTITFYLKDSVNVIVTLKKSSYIVSSMFEGQEFNQIKGMTIEGHIENKQLKTVYVFNNAECVYFITDEDTALMGVNVSATSEMKIILTDNEIDGIVFYNDPDGKIYPDKDLTDKDRRLKDFRWLDFYRPETVEDLYVRPIPRVKGEEQSVLPPSDTSQ